MDDVEQAKILFLSPFFYPEAISTGKYNSVLVERLVARGAAAEVICSHPFYPAWKAVKSRATLPGVSIHRGGAWVPYPRPMILRRLVFEIWFAWWAAFQTWRLRDGIDTAVLVFPPSFYCLPVFKLLPVSTRTIGIVHDLQGILGLSGSGLATRAIARVVHAIEKRGFQSCDTLIALSDSMAARIRQDYEIADHKIVVRCPFVTVKPGNKLGTNLEQLFPTNQTHVVYSGALGKKQNPYGLLDFFRQAAHKFPRLHFHVFSGGPIFDDLAKTERFSERISFHPLVDESDLEELYARSDVQVIPQLERTSDACLPSKLPNILAMGCAVLSICGLGTDLASILQRTDCGVTADSWDHEVLMRGLDRVLDKAEHQSRKQRQDLVFAILGNQFSLDALVDTVLGVQTPERARTAEIELYNG